MEKIFNFSLFFVLLTVGFCQCKKTTIEDTTGSASTTYSGTASITQGKATTTTSNLFTAGMRLAGLGTITSKDAKIWTVPAEVNFTNSSFPFASDLYNSYVSGHSYSTASSATAALNGTDVITIDSTGEIYTAYVFCDNYFEMYVNGTPVGKDAIPYTDFNASIIRFKAKKPFTIAVKCVDWEENLGLGTEMQGSTANHIGDGGFVAVIKNGAGTIETTTNNTWKAQTYYISPISDLSCLVESGNYRYSNTCSTSTASTTSYGAHWSLPANWFNTSFDDTSWPSATTFTNETVGVIGKPSYTNFADIFDNSSNNASFIWSTNLLLDNLVLIRKKVE